MSGELVEQRLKPPPNGPADYNSLRGIGIAATAIRSRPHAGLLYRWKKEVRLFELVGHKVLRDDVATPGFVWIEPHIPLERMRLVAGRARLVHKRHLESAVPYGFRYEVSSFDENGVFRLGSGEVGFTCSTIVAAILDAEGVRHIDPKTWPAPDGTDIQKREEFLRDLAKKDPEHEKLLRHEINAPRISPDEVVASAATYPKVGTFENLLNGAAKVRDRIGTT